MKGHSVKMITKNTESVSSIYSKYIVLSMPKMQWFKNIHFKIDNFNIFWFISWIITMIFDTKNYFNYKNYAIKQSEEIIRSYGLNYQMCGNQYSIDFPFIFMSFNFAVSIIFSEILINSLLTNIS